MQDLTPFNRQRQFPQLASLLFIIYVFPNKKVKFTVSFAIRSGKVMDQAFEDQGIAKQFVQA